MSSRHLDSKLRKTGLSKMKVEYIKEISKKIESKELNITKTSQNYLMKKYY